MSATTNYMEYTQISHFPNTEASSSEWRSQIQGLQMDHHSGIFVLVLPSSFIQDVCCHISRQNTDLFPKKFIIQLHKTPAAAINNPYLPVTNEEPKKAD